MADNENVIGLAMQLDVSNIKEGVKEVNKIIKSSKDEFNNATAGMDMWSKSSEGLNAKLGQLGKQLSAQQKLAKGYEAEIERVKNQEGDHTEELARLNEKLQKAQNEIKKTESQMNHYSDSLVAVQREEKDANSALGKLTKTIEDQKKELNNLTKDYKSAVLQYGKNSREAKDLAKKIKQLSGEIEDNEDKVKKSEKAFDNLGRSLEDLGSKALEKSVKGVAKVGAAITGLVGSFLATAEATREMRTNMGKVDTAFKESGFTAEQAENTYKKFYGVLGDEGQATEAVSHLAKLATSQEDLSKWTDICTGVYATFGDSLPIEGLTEAANETAKTGELTGGLADALNWVGISEDAFQDKLDKCSSEQERQKLITDTLTKAYGDASKQYQETNKDVIASQEAQAELSKAMSDIGAKAEPIMTQFKLMGAKMLEALLPVLEKIIPFVQEHLPALAIVAGTVTAAISTLAATIGILKLKTELATIATVAKTVAEKAAAGATKAAAAAQWLFNAAMSANPIGIVIIAITALVAAFVVLWKKSDAFREFWQKLWDGIKKAAKVAIDAIGKFFSACWDGIKKAWNGAGKFFSGIWKKIRDAFKDTTKWFSDKFSKAWDGVKKAFGKVGSFFSGVYKDVVNAFKSIPESLKKFFTSAWDKIKSAFTGVTKFFSGIAEKVVDGFKSLSKNMANVGKNLVEGLWNGVKNMTSWITDKLKGFSDSVLKGIKKFFGIHSPSTEMAEIGKYMGEGLANGLIESSDKVVSAGAEIGTQMGTSILNAFDKLSRKIERQNETLKSLESQYKSAVITFGATSKEAYSIGRNIVTLSRELAENELKVKSLDDEYKNLNSTLATQMRLELSTSKKTLADLEAQKKVLNEINLAGKDYVERQLHVDNLRQLNSDIEQTKNVIKSLTDDLDYLAKAGQEALASETTTENVEEQKNAFQQLQETIEQQREELEKLKSEYESAIITFGESSQQANTLGEQIKKVTDELKANEKSVEDLDEAYQKLTNKVEPEIEIEKTAYEKLQDTIAAQKESLESLRNEYSTVVLTFGESSAEAENLAKKIRTLTDKLKANEKTVANLDEAYNKLTMEPVVIEVDDRHSLEKWIDDFEDKLGLSEKKLEKWSNGAGKYVNKVSSAFSKIAGNIGSVAKTIGDYFDKIWTQRIKEIDKELELIKGSAAEKVEAEQEAAKNEVAGYEETAKNELAALNRLYDQELISAEEYRAQKAQIESDLANNKEKREIQSKNLIDDINNAALESERKLMNERDELARKQFEARQKNSIAEAVIDGASAIVKGFAQLGPIAGAINAVAQAGITAAQIAAIKAEKYVPALAKGGVADGATLAMIGEAGKEAVIPLERNTGWMETLAEKLAAIMQKDMLSGVQAGSPAFAMAGNGQTVVNNYYNQTINSPKALTRREIYRDSKNLLALKG